MGKIKEDIFNIARFMLNAGKDIETIMNVTGLSAVSIDRISKAGTYLEFDEQRKTRSAEINRHNEKKEKAAPPKQINIDDVLPPVDPLIMVRDAINKNTEIVENFMKQICEILRGA